jgi:hypothetical protein
MTVFELMLMATLKHGLPLGAIETEMMASAVRLCGLRTRWVSDDDGTLVGVWASPQQQQLYFDKLTILCGQIHQELFGKRHLPGFILRHRKTELLDT